MTTAAGRPLSVRLAAILSLAVVSVLLVTGLAVNRLVSAPLEAEQDAAQRDRLTVVAAGLADADWSAPRGQVAIRQVLRRVATATRGRASLVDEVGRTIISVGRLPAGVETDQISEAIAAKGSILVEVPRPERSFLRVFNLTLLLAGLLAVMALVAIAVYFSDRLTRPLRGVAAAAHRLGAGDLTARAIGGPDRESAELADAFNAMAARLQRSEMLRRRAASDMAHDLATPVTVLESQLQAMVDGVLPADPAELEHARAAAGALSGVVVQLRDLVDAESALLTHHPSRVAIWPWLSDLGREMEPMFRQRGVTLDLAPSSGSAEAEIDGLQVARAVRNVLTNAAQHSPPNGRVSVDLEIAPREALIRVRDQGGGIAADDLPHLFERFYRADQSRAAGEPRAGSGIGLTIARELLAANGGRIEVEQTGPAGTTFVISLQRVA